MYTYACQNEWYLCCTFQNCCMGYLPMIDTAWLVMRSQITHCLSKSIYQDVLQRKSDDETVQVANCENYQCYTWFHNNRLHIWIINSHTSQYTRWYNECARHEAMKILQWWYGLQEPLSIRQAQYSSHIKFWVTVFDLEYALMTTDLLHNIHCRVQIIDTGST